MRKILIYSFIIMVFLISFSSAEIHWDSVASNDCIDLDQTCPTCTYVNISMVQYPNDSSIFPNYAMTNSGDKFYYSFCNTSQIGQYHITLIGDKDGVVSSEEGYFEVTPNGYVLSLSEAIIYILLSVFSIGIFVFFLYWGIRIDWHNEIDERGSIIKVTKSKYMKLFCWWLATGFFMWGLSMITSIVNNYITLSSTRNFITSLFLYSGRLTFIATVVFMFVFMLMLWKDILVNGQIKKYGRAYLK